MPPPNHPSANPPNHDVNARHVPPRTNPPPTLHPRSTQPPPTCRPAPHPYPYPLNYPPEHEVDGRYVAPLPPHQLPGQLLQGGHSAAAAARHSRRAVRPQEQERLSNLTGGGAAEGAGDAK